MKWFVAAALTATTLLAGCATTHDDPAVAADADVIIEVEPMEPAHVAVVPTPPPVPPVLNSVEFLSPELEKRLVVTNTTYERSPNGRFRVLCTFKNLTGAPLSIQARTQFFDDERRHQEGPDPWSVIFLPPNGIETYTGYSLRDDLDYYYVEVLAL